MIRSVPQGPQAGQMRDVCMLSAEHTAAAHRTAANTYSPAGAESSLAGLLLRRVLQGREAGNRDLRTHHTPVRAAVVLRSWPR